MRKIAEKAGGVMLAALVLLTFNCIASDSLGRPVRIVSLSFQAKPLERVAALVDEEGAKGADLIALPETFIGKPQPIDGPSVSTMMELARKHKTYIVCPIKRQDGDKLWNSSVLLDRQGKIAMVYDKVFPTIPELNLKVSPGGEVPVYQADFGRVGLAICYDVNFPEIWQRLADHGAELVIWSSAYSAGSSLQAHAINHHYYIVTSTLSRDCIVYDITGERIFFESSPDINISRMVLDLDRGIYHQNFNIEKRDKLLAERKADVVQERYMNLEQWFVLKARRPGVRARDVARGYGLEELRDFITRARGHIDNARGSSFYLKTIGENKK